VLTTIKIFHVVKALLWILHRIGRRGSSVTLKPTARLGQNPRKESILSAQWRSLEVLLGTELKRPVPMKTGPQPCAAGLHGISLSVSNDLGHGPACQNVWQLFT
jgi:hypothetical protein